MVSRPAGGADAAVVCAFSIDWFAVWGLLAAARTWSGERRPSRGIGTGSYGLSRILVIVLVYS